jgi:Clostripain family
MVAYRGAASVATRTPFPLLKNNMSFKMLHSLFSKVIFCVLAWVMAWSPLAAGAQIVASQPLAVSTGKAIKRTIFVYMIGSDLESQGGEGAADLKEMTESTSSPHINLVVQTGGADSVGWNIGRRLSVSNGIIQEHDTLGKLNMGKSESLSDFLLWGIKRHPAQEYMLILWSHGSGSVNLQVNEYGLVGPDEIFEDSLTAAEIRLALERVKTSSAATFSMIGFDACLMGTVEVANLLQPYAKYLIASQELEPGSGWNYKAWLTSLAKQPEMDALLVGKKIVDSYFDFYKGKGDAKQLTLSLTDLEKLPGLISAVDAWAGATSKVVDKSGKAAWDFARARSLTENYGREGRFDSGMVDLGDFVAKAAKQLSASAASSSATSQAASKQSPELSARVAAQVKSAVAYSRSSADRNWASGLSTFIPSSFQLFDDETSRAVKSQIKPLAMSPVWKAMLDTYRNTLKDSPIDFQINAVSLDAANAKLMARMDGNADVVDEIFLAMVEERGDQITVVANALIDEDVSVNGSQIAVGLQELQLISFEGQIAYYWMIEYEEDYRLMAIPALINDQQSDILIRMNVLGSVVSFKVLGYKPASQEATNKLKAFKANDAVALAYPQLSKKKPDDYDFVTLRNAQRLGSAQPKLALLPVQKRAGQRIGFYFMDQNGNFVLSTNTLPY